MKKLKPFWFLLIIVIFVQFSCAKKNTNENEKDKIVVTPPSVDSIKHVNVFYEKGQFAGWPANNGIWNWENEILVGFVQADHLDSTGHTHTYDISTSRYKYARSLDGGLTWEIEDAFEGGQKAWTYQNQRRSKEVEPIQLTKSIDFSDPNFVFTISRISNHKGPSIFYYSYDRGKKWDGPFQFPDLDTRGVAARTDYLIESSDEMNVFVTVAKSNENEGRVAMFRTTDGGVSWENNAWLGDEPEGFDIMPSSVRLGPNDILTAIRSRDNNPRRDYIKLFRSETNGDSWQELAPPVFDTGWGGSPPALLKLADGRLALAYIFRSKYGSRVCLRLSSDEGQSWSHEIPLRVGDGATNDVGYPRMVQRPDGKLVVVYYWNNALQENSVPYRYIAATIADPKQWE